MTMKTFETKKNEIYNSISDSVKSNTAFHILWESWNEKSDYSVVEALINSIYYISATEALITVELMIKEDISTENLLYKLSDMIKKSPYTIGKGVGDVEKFREFVIEIIKTNYKYNFKTLYMFANLLEYMFAYGYKGLADSIAYLYDILPSEDSVNGKYRIHKKLVMVYGYNGMNYTELNDMLNETYKYCKASKQKFMYGEIYYYHAVLEIMSDGKYSYDLQEYLEKACAYRYDLAHILKLHTNKDF